MIAFLHSHEGKAKVEAEQWASMYRARVEVLKRTDLRRPLYIASIGGEIPSVGEWEVILEIDGRVGEPTDR